MPSLVSGYEYDIFISYRHNDNRSGWVTDFVAALQEELAGTIKHSVSIYFDKHPHDGLLETHDIDKSLEGKLKCLIFIPILSQTYCDPKSFAWRHEFCAFNKMASEDRFGRQIKLSNGNVASRILPIKIHRLDEDDQSIIENEIAGLLRAIEFIYAEPGVNRPLKPSDDRNENQNKTEYRNQVNKVANSAKNLLHSLEYPAPDIADKGRINSTIPIVPRQNRRKFFRLAAVGLLLAISVFVFYYVSDFANVDPAADRSIAVLPFDNMTKDSQDEYFASGMTEDILNHLAKIGDLQLKSRTSTLQYKGTTKTVAEIGKELGVANIVEGSVRKVGERVRIVVQLIDAKRDIHLWSETYDRDLEDVLDLPSKIAIEIAEALKAKLSYSERKDISKEVTNDFTAYDFYLQAREKYLSIKYTKESLIEILELLDRAIDKDPKFALAYSVKAQVWFEMTSFGNPEPCVDSAFANARKSVTLDAEAPEGYLALASMNQFLGRFAQYERELQTAYKISPGNQQVESMYGYYLLDHGDDEGAELIVKSIGRNYSTRQPEYYNAMAGPYFYIQDYQSVIRLMEKLKELNPSSTSPYAFLGRMYVWILKDYDKAKSEAEALLKLVPNDPVGLDVLGWVEYQKGRYNNAVEIWRKHREIESTYEDSTQVIPFRHREAMALLKLGRKAEAFNAIKEEIESHNRILASKTRIGTWANLGGVYYGLAVCHALSGKEALAVQNLDSAVKYKFIVRGLYDNDPAFDKIKDKPSFQKVQKKVDVFFEFRRRAFMKALNTNKASDELKQFLNR